MNRAIGYFDKMFEHQAQADRSLKLTLFHFFVIRMLANYQLDSSKGVSLSERENIAAMILSWTGCSEYDLVREYPEFVALREKLSGYAGENDY